MNTRKYFVLHNKENILKICDATKAGGKCIRKEKRLKHSELSINFNVRKPK